MSRVYFLYFLLFTIIISSHLFSCTQLPATVPDDCQGLAGYITTLAEENKTCLTDDDCKLVGAGKATWSCDGGGAYLSVNKSIAAQTQNLIERYLKKKCEESIIKGLPSDGGGSGPYCVRPTNSSEQGYCSTKTAKGNCFNHDAGSFIPESAPDFSRSDSPSEQNIETDKNTEK